MRKRIGAMIAVLALLMGTGGCQSYDDVSIMLGADVNTAKVVAAKDSHGGFHGDGERYMEFQFADDAFEHAIQKDQTWHPLPIRDAAVKSLLYGNETGDISYGSYIHAELPQIETGYYFFYDRHPECTEPFDASKVLGRSSVNFTAALYDAEQDMLYFIEQDT